MKQIVVNNIQVVGKHRYVHWSLNLSMSYHVKIEGNELDVAVMDGHRKVGNLNKYCARLINKIINSDKLKSELQLRPIYKPSVQIGTNEPQQTCVIYFNSEETDI